MLNNEASNKIIDLTSHYVILGSGLSAISTIQGITDNNINNIKKIFVIDAGLTEKVHLRIDKRNDSIKMPSPKFKIRANRYIYYGFKSMLNITENSFQVIGSLAKGGLSNIWGATIQPYNEAELSKFPYSYAEINDAYVKTYKTLTDLDHNFYDFDEQDSDSKKFITFNPLLAINPMKNKRDSCYLKSCGDGCIYCNRNVFNSGDEIDDFVGLNKIDYMPGLFIKSIYQEDGYYFIECMDITSKNVVLIKADTIYSCLGAISTSKIVLKMSEKDNKIPLLSTPGGAFFIYSFKDFFKKGKNILSSKSFKGNADKNNFEGNIFPFSENLLCTYFGERLGGIFNFLFGKLLFSRLFIANIYFDSDLSSSTISYSKDKIQINSKIDSNLKLVFKKAIGIIKKEFLLKGLLVIPFSKKLLVPGQDIHYGGSIPMKLDPKENQCNFNGELKGFKNFYISDAASMPFLASKGQSFNCMVNAYYIASKSIKDELRISSKKP